MTDNSHAEDGDGRGEFSNDGDDGHSVRGILRVFLKKYRDVPRLDDWMQTRNGQ